MDIHVTSHTVNTMYKSPTPSINTDVHLDAAIAKDFPDVFGGRSGPPTEDNMNVHGAFQGLITGLVGIVQCFLLKDVELKLHVPGAVDTVGVAKSRGNHKDVRDGVSALYDW